MRIFITGAESTGKSTLAKLLAEHFNAPFVEEFARVYISGLNRNYDINDLEVIGRKQIEQISSHKADELVFYDTGLIITYIWYQDKYGIVPDLLKQAIPVFGKGKYLLCDTDIKWENDSVRENPHRRHELNQIYESTIREYGFELKLVGGQGEERLNNAIEIVGQCLENA